MDRAAGVARQQDGRATQVDGAVRPRPGQGAGEAQHEGVAAEEDLELGFVARTGDIGVRRHFEDGVGEIRRALLDVVEQPTHEFVLECFAIHWSERSQ